MLSRRALGLVSILGLLASSAVFAGAPKGKPGGTVKLVKLEPPAESSVGRDSVVIAELQFTIDSFTDMKDRYHISIQFQTSDSRTSTFSNGPGDIVKLSRAIGTITLAYHLDRVWDDPKLRKPPVVRYFLVESTGKHEIMVLDMTDAIHFAVRD